MLFWLGVPLAPNRWRGALLALAARSLRLQRVVHDGAAFGYENELTPSARAMLSALVTLATSDGVGASRNVNRPFASSPSASFARSVVRVPLADGHAEKAD